MTAIFWGASITLVLIAYLIILPPLFRKREASAGAGENADQRNINIARERLAELKANREAGGISPEQYEEQASELELALADDLSIAQQNQETHGDGRWLGTVLAVLIPALAFGLYFTLGDYGAIGRSKEQSVQEMPSPEAINNMVAKLAEKLKAEPDDLQGWLMLGRSYKVLQRYPEAVSALDHAYQLGKNNSDVLLQYAEALMLANNNSWQGKPVELINQALELQPENLNGLWFAAMSSAQQGDKTKAVVYLKKMEQLLPADSEDRKQIGALIANAGSAGESSSAPEEKAQAGQSSSPEMKITVQVRLADELKTRAAPGDTVFIYAQAVSGPKMPLAISRRQVSDLPITVTLSDADAMMPAMKLSNFKQVRLLARISKSASAMPMPGDLIGAVEQADIGKAHDFSIVIDDQVK